MQNNSIIMSDSFFQDNKGFHEVNFILNGLNATYNLAAQIAARVKTADIICLDGDLGAGKTTFVQAFINSFYAKPVNVTSPTFNLLQQYETKNFTIWHYDLYRVESEDELTELGLEDAFNNGITIVEWPKIIRSILPDNRIEISLAHYEEIENRRVVTMKGYGFWSMLLKEMYS